MDWIRQKHSTLQLEAILVLGLPSVERFLILIQCTIDETSHSYTSETSPKANGGSVKEAVPILICFRIPLIPLGSAVQIDGKCPDLVLCHSTQLSLPGAIDKGGNGAAMSYVINSVLSILRSIFF